MKLKKLLNKIYKSQYIKVYEVDDLSEANLYEGEVCDLKNKELLKREVSHLFSECREEIGIVIKKEVLK